jgi:hypothetical protein
MAQREAPFHTSALQRAAAHLEEPAMKHRIRTLLAAALLATAGSVRPALACGGFFCS